MKVLNLLGAGHIGGIEKLCKDIAAYADYENTFVFLFEEGVVYEEMKAAGHSVCSLAEYGHKKINFQRLSALYKLAKDYDIINVHHNGLSIHVCYICLKWKFPEKKYILTAHSCFEPEMFKALKNPLKRSLRFRCQKKSLDISDMIIFVSNAGKKSYLSYYSIPEKKTKVVYNGIIVPEEEPDFKTPKDQRAQFILTYIGRLVEVKGVQNFIEAIALLKKKNINCKAYICGEGGYRQTLEKLAESYHLTEDVHFEGVQRNIRKYLLKTDIFVYPSICEEIFGISIVEALSYGVPCAVNRVGGIPEIIEDGWNGAISEEKSAKGMCSAIERILRMYRSKEIENISRNCFETAKRFSICDTVAGIKECCEKVME